MRVNNELIELLHQHVRFILFFKYILLLFVTQLRDRTQQVTPANDLRLQRHLTFRSFWTQNVRLQRHLSFSRFWTQNLRWHRRLAFIQFWTKSQSLYRLVFSLILLGRLPVLLNGIKHER